MKKLVRDRIPEIIKESGQEPVVRTLEEEEFKQALKSKLVEEAEEVTEVNEHSELMAELADVYEVLENLYQAYGIDPAEIIDCARKKKEERGGFEEKLFLEEIK